MKLTKAMMAGLLAMRGYPSAKVNWTHVGTRRMCRALERRGLFRRDWGGGYHATVNGELVADTIYETLRLDGHTAATLRGEGGVRDQASGNGHQGEGRRDTR